MSDPKESLTLKIYTLGGLAIQVGEQALAGLTSKPKAVTLPEVGDLLKDRYRLDE